MENLEMLKILQRIKLFLNTDSLDLARDTVQLELENLKGITEEKCKGHRLYCDDWYCHYCSNTNCPSNLSK